MMAETIESLLPGNVGNSKAQYYRQLFMAEERKWGEFGIGLYDEYESCGMKKILRPSTICRRIAEEEEEHGRGVRWQFIYNTTRSYWLPIVNRKKNKYKHV